MIDNGACSGFKGFERVKSLVQPDLDREMRIPSPVGEPWMAKLIRFMPRRYPVSIWLLQGPIAVCFLLQVEHPSAKFHPQRLGGVRSCFLIFPPLPSVALLLMLAALGMYFVISSRHRQAWLTGDVCEHSIMFVGLVISRSFNHVRASDWGSRSTFSCMH